MGKRRNGLGAPEELLSVQAPKSDEPKWRPLDLPPQVTGSLAGLAGFMGLDVKRVAFTEQTVDGARHLSLLVDPKAQGKDARHRFAAALSDGPVKFVKQDGIGQLVHESGNHAFYHACRSCAQVSQTLATIAQHVDVVEFQLSNGHKKPVQKPAKRRVTPQHTRR